ncbi:hypothetical protein [Domibacillus tundrae]|uniref:hypothetical protein n=1 Tax=Domibacillus tundrae TaxID=1587527 RepID=UPI0006181855|nr:hypothetical protein [Domibacillus tundrae]
MLTPQRDGKKLTYNDLETMPEKIELFSGKLDGAQDMLNLCLYNLGLEQFVNGLPEESKEILKALLEEKEGQNSRLPIARHNEGFAPLKKLVTDEPKKG